MNVFVETNFVMELALEQEQSEACEKLLRLAQDHALHLLLPAYSLIEPHETITRRRLDREALKKRVETELAQIARSTSLSSRVAASLELVRLLSDSADFEIQGLERVKERIWSIAEVLPLSTDVLRDTAECKAKFNLSPQDAVVYASIRARLATEHDSVSCFVSRNPGDFEKIEVRQDLAAFNCKYFSSFEVALQYIEHTLNRQ